MLNKEGGDFYRSLSRKELQSLCKKYGLPARKSSSEMAESLYSYSQKKNLSFAGSSKSMGGIQEVLVPPSSLKPMQVQVPSSLTEHVIRDSCQLRFNPREECNKGYKMITCNQLESCMDLTAHNKEFVGGSVHYSRGASQSQFVSKRAESCGRIEHASLCRHRYVNEGVCFKENISDIRSFDKIPSSFEFYARSEEGIELCVDLSSSPLDWIKKYKNQVSFCKNVDIAKSKGFHEELGHIGENNKQIKKSFPHAGDFDEKVSDGLVEAKSSISLDMEEDNAGSDHREGMDKPLMLLPPRTCSEVFVEDSDCLREDLGPISSNPNSDVQVHIISNKELCNKNGSNATLVSDITACNFVFDSISDGSVDLVAIENQNLIYEDEIHEKSPLRKNCDLENNCVVPRFLTSSPEMKLSQTGNSHKGESSLAYKNGETLGQDHSNHNVVTEQAALTTSSGNDHIENHLAEFTEDQDGSDISFGRGSSECSQVENSVGKTCFISSNLESKEEFPKKRLATDNGVQNGYSKPDTKILKSSNHSGGEVLPRRSIRLVSK